jgi:hypothetical protein
MYFKLLLPAFYSLQPMFPKHKIKYILKSSDDGVLHLEESCFWTVKYYLNISTYSIT